MINCKGCGEQFEKLLVYSGHTCSALTDIDGEVLAVGDILQYVDGHTPLYQLLPTSKMTIPAGHGYGQRLRSSNDPQVLYTRLMRRVS